MNKNIVAKSLVLVLTALSINTVYANRSKKRQAMVIAARNMGITIAELNEQLENRGLEIYRLTRLPENKEKNQSLRRTDSIKVIWLSAKTGRLTPMVYLTDLPSLK